MKMSWLAAVLAVAVAACGGDPQGASAAGGTQPPDEDMPRAFFVAPRDGDMISIDLPVLFEFDTEHFTISAVPSPGEPHRAGVGHYHLAVDTACLRDGVSIPQEAPWIHLDDGSDVMEMFLEAGEYSFTVQVGDDAHLAVPGLCETISMTVEDGV